MRNWLSVISIGFLLLLLAGCVGDVVTPTAARVFRYHTSENIKDLERFIPRLYAKNPKYQPDPVRRRKRIQQIFYGRPILDKYAAMPSNEVLTAAFAPKPEESDRVYLLGLGLVKSIKEAYGINNDQVLFTALQVPVERLQRLYRNLSQVNWRLKTYRDAQGELLFRTNELGVDGYLNMGYEIIMTAILTRVQDDIYLRGGLPLKYIFDMSTLFVSVVM